MTFPSTESWSTKRSGTLAGAVQASRAPVSDMLRIVHGSGPNPASPLMTADFSNALRAARRFSVLMPCGL
jgi:hypothetical protein